MEELPWQERYAKKVKSARQALRVVKRGDSVFVGSGAGVPQLLVEELARMSAEFADNEIVHLWTLGIAPYTEPKFKYQFRHNAFFIGDNVRDAVAEGRADYTPIFLSKIPKLFRSRRMRVDVEVIQVTPPNEHGFCSFGVSVDIVKPAAEAALYVIAEANPCMPWTLGDSFIHVNDIDVLVENEAPIPELSYPEADGIARGIGENMARLIIAVTGSVNQRGEVQAVGGVTEKVEGFYDVCRIKGATVDQGVIVPEQNVRNLMLRDDVVEAVRQGKFHLYSVETIDDGISILTGRDAGER